MREMERTREHCKPLVNALTPSTSVMRAEYTLASWSWAFACTLRVTSLTPVVTDVLGKRNHFRFHMNASLLQVYVRFFMLEKYSKQIPSAIIEAWRELRNHCLSDDKFIIYFWQIINHIMCISRNRFYRNIEVLKKNKIKYITEND